MTSPDEHPIEALWTEARAVWPQVEVSLEAFGAAATPLLEEGPIAADRLAELYLACGCAAGNRRALEVFERDFVDVVPGALRGFNLHDADLDEVRQTVRQRLLLATDGPPRILRYAGRGSMRGLVRMTATRVAIDLVRRRDGTRVDGADDLLRLPVGQDDPELAAMKAEFRTEFKVAFEFAMAELTSHQRTLLRLHLVDGVPLQKLADAHGVHRATIVRRISAAKTALLDATVRVLSAQAGADPDEMRSVMRLIQSRVELSVRRVLGRD